MTNKRQPVSIRAMLEGEGRDARLYRDTLLWLLLHGYAPHDVGFNITDLGNWLIDNNRDLRKEFAGEPLRKSLRLHTKRSYITSCVKTMVTMGLLAEAGRTQAQKNRLETTIYCQTIYGELFAKILKAYDEKGESRKLAQQYALRSFEAFFDASGRVVSALTARTINELTSQSKFTEDVPVLEMISMFVLYDEDPVERLFRFLRGWEPFSGIFTKNLRQTESPAMEEALLEIKLRLEGETDKHAGKAWRFERSRCNADRSIAVLDIICEKCKKHYPLGVHLIQLLDSRLTGKRTVDGTWQPRKGDCILCGARQSTHPTFTLSPFWETAIGIPKTSRWAGKD